MFPDYHFEALVLGPIRLQIFGTLVVLGIIAGHSVGCRRNTVRSRRELQLGLHIPNTESGTRGRGVLGEDLNAEKLMKIADVSRDHHQRRDGWNA